MKGEIYRHEKKEAHERAKNLAKRTARNETLIRIPNSQPPAWVAVRKNETETEAIERYNSRVSKFVVDNKNW